MYVKRIQIENVGPIQYVDLECSFNGDAPIPLILVGPNGGGKTIVLSFIANWLAMVQQTYCDNPDIKHNTVLKYRSPLYIASGKEYYRCHVELTNDFVYSEWQLRSNRDEFEISGKFHPDHSSWDAIPQNQSSLLMITPDINQIKNKSILEHAMNSGVFLYFPANRFDEPAWYNIDNLNYLPDAESLSYISRKSDRRIVMDHPLRIIMDWMYGVIIDSHVIDVIRNPYMVETDGGVKSILMEVKRVGPSTDLVHLIVRVLSIALRTKFASGVRLYLGDRHARFVGLTANDANGKEVIVPNLFSLASGESSLISIFLSIIRDFDLTKSEFTPNMSGIVLIDEIDLHLHVEIQRDILPKLIKLFPKVQFIITTHSPLFLLGMEKEFGSDGYAIIEMPSGQRIGCEAYREFGHAYETYKNTRRFDDDMQSILHELHKPVIFVEGETDEKYLKTAIQILNREKLIDAVDIRWIGHRDESGHVTNTGKDALDKLVGLLTIQPELISFKIIALYDVDVSRDEEVSGKLIVMRMPYNRSNTKFTKGVENLLPAELAREEFYKVKTKDNGDGGSTIINSLNKIELCNYVCDERRDEVDFYGFVELLDRIEQLLL